VGGVSSARNGSARNVRTVYVPPSVPDPSRSRFLCATIELTAILDVLKMPTSMALIYVAFVANAFGLGALHNVPPGHDDHSHQSPQSPGQLIDLERHQTNRPL
jgi:hypothetical protein